MLTENTIMKILRRIFYTLTAVILIPTLCLVGIILWSYTTGSTLRLPSFSFHTVRDEPGFLEQAAVMTADVYDESGQNVIGRRAYITISKADLGRMTADQYLSFYQSVVRDSGYSWFSVLCGDGTGLFIPDCVNGSAQFGSLDEEGCIVSVYGYMTVTGDSCSYSEAH